MRLRPAPPPGCRSKRSEGTPMTDSLAAPAVPRLRNADRGFRRGDADRALDQFQIAVFSSPSQGEALWREALASGAGYVFQTFEWQSAYQATIGAAEGVLPCIVQVADRDG